MSDLLRITHTGNTRQNNQILNRLHRQYATPRGMYTTWGIKDSNQGKTFIVEESYDWNEQVYIFRKPCWSSGGVPETLYTVPNRQTPLYLDNLARRLTTVLHLSCGEPMPESDLRCRLNTLPSDFNLIPFFTEISESGISVKGKQSLWGYSFHVGKFVFMERLCGLSSKGDFQEIKHTNKSLSKMLREMRSCYNAPRFEMNKEFYAN